MNHILYSKSNYSLSCFHSVVGQNIEQGSHYYNNRLYLKKTFWDDLIEVYDFLDRNKIIISIVHKNLLLKKYFDTRSILIDLRMSSSLKMEDVLILFKKYWYISKWGIVVSILPVKVLNLFIPFLRKFKNQVKNYIQ